MRGPVQARVVCKVLRAGSIAIGLMTVSQSVLVRTAAGAATHSSSRTDTSSTNTVSPRRLDNGLLQLLLRIREAEIAADDSALATCATDAAKFAPEARTLAIERISLARNATARRNAARSGLELARAEEENATARLKLRDMATVGGDREAQRALTLELELEAAEDLLFRRLAADSTDAALALGVTTAAERAAIEDTLTRVRELLPVALIETVLSAKPDAIATDPATFRKAMLGGVLALAESDLARDGAADLAPSDAMVAVGLKRADERRTDAVQLLDIASRTELPLPRAIAELLGLARARANVRDSAVRERLFAEAARAKDPAIALVAAIEQTPPGMPGPESVRTAEGALGVIAACASARRAAVATLTSERLAGNTSALDMMFASIFERAASDASRTGDPSDALAAVAAACALRFDRPMRALASRPIATPLYGALAVLRANADGVRVELTPEDEEALRALTDQAARDPRIAPWFAIPYASAIVRLDPANAGRASDLLLALAERSTPTERTRAALAIALDERRARAPRSAADERRLAEALAIAARVFERDLARDEWILESVDLALFPRFGTQDLAEAARLLATLSADTPGREMRAIELDALREPSAKELERLRQRAAAYEQVQVNGPGALGVRNDAVRSALAARAGDFAESITLAVRAIDTDPSSQAAERAVAIWTTSLLADTSDRVTTGSGAGAAAFAVAKQLSNVAARSASTRAALTSAAEVLAERIDRTCDAGVATSADAATRARLYEDGMRLVAITASLARTTDGPRTEPLRALGLLLANDTTARDVARDVVSVRPDDRSAAWVLGEALLRSNDMKERAEGFAILRDLAPIGETQRDRFWWRAQAAMLETLAAEVARGDVRRTADLSARANRLESIDPALGGPAIKRRIETARTMSKGTHGGADSKGSAPGGPSAEGRSTNDR